MMRRWMAVTLAALMVLSLAACTGGQQEEQSAAAETTEQGQEVSSEDAEQSQTASVEEPTSTEQQPEDSTSAEQQPTSEQESGVLVAYFSWADNAVIEGEVDAVASPSVTAPGNVQQLAQWVSERTGGDLFSIQVTEPYSSDWDACLERANQERAEDARPELAASVEQLERYDTVFLGYPNWVVRRADGAALLFGGERPLGQAGLPVLLPRYRRPCQQRRADRRGAAGQHSPVGKYL